MKAFATFGIAEMQGNELTTVFAIRAQSPLSSFASDPSDTVPTMAEALTIIDAFVGTRLVSLFNHKYDAPMLRKLYRGEGLPVPEWMYFCGLELSRHSGSRSSSLIDNAVAFNLYSPEEVRARSLTHRITPTANKWLLHDAADDAAANALLVAYWSRKAKLSYRALLDQAQVKIRPLNAPSPKPKTKKTVRSPLTEADVSARVNAVAAIAEATKQIDAAEAAVKQGLNNARAGLKQSRNAHAAAWKAARSTGWTDKELRATGVRAPN